MTQNEFDNHDCTKGLEDGCDCDKMEIEEDYEDNTYNDNEVNDEEDHLEELDNECIPDYSNDGND